MTDILKKLQDITLRQLRTFRSVAACGNISAAARELHLTQPAVSMQLKELENACGQPLYERAGRGIQLTAAGQALEAAATSVLDTLNSVQETLDAMAGLETGLLKLAVVSTGNYFAPSVLLAFRKEYPGINAQLMVGNRDEVIARLANNECDLAIMGTPPSELETHAVEIAEHPQVIIASAQHPLAKAKQVRLKDLSQEGFVVREQGSGTRNAMERFFRSKRFKYQAVMEASSNETIKQAVMAGMGLSFISRHTIALELAAGKLAILDVEGLPVVRAWHVMHRQGKRLSPAAEAFFEYLRVNGARCVEESLKV